MAGFSTWAQVREAKRDGAIFRQAIHKTNPSTLAGTSGAYWTLGAMPAAGAAPVGAVTYTSTAGGIVFPDTAPVHKYLLRYQHCTTKGPGMVQIHDRLVAFGAVAATGVGAKASVTPALPRYTTGAGVRVVIEVRSQTLTATRTITLTYTNELGVGSRTSSSVVLPTSSGGGLTNQTFYVGLQAGDLGVRSVEAVNVTAETGGGTSTIDVVLYYPLVQIVGEPQLTTAAAAQSYWLHARDYFAEIAAVPRIFDGATLAFHCLPGDANGGQDNSFRSDIEVIYR